MPTLQTALTILSRLRRTLHPNSHSPRPRPFLLLGVNDSTQPPVVSTTKTLKLGKLLGRSQPSPRTVSPLSTQAFIILHLPQMYSAVSLFLLVADNNQQALNTFRHHQPPQLKNAALNNHSLNTLRHHQPSQLSPMLLHPIRLLSLSMFLHHQVLQLLKDTALSTSQLLGPQDVNVRVSVSN